MIPVDAKLLIDQPPPKWAVEVMQQQYAEIERLRALIERGGMNAIPLAENERLRKEIERLREMWAAQQQLNVQAQGEIERLRHELDGADGEIRRLANQAK